MTAATGIAAHLRRRFERTSDLSGSYTRSVCDLRQAYWFVEGVAVTATRVLQSAIAADPAQMPAVPRQDAERPPPEGDGLSSKIKFAQWNESPQAHDPEALGLSMVKPCFWMVSSKSMVAPSR